MSRMTTALLVLGLAFLALAGVVASNDKGSATEVALLQGTPVVATDKQCDTMYHAEWIARGTPAHAGIVASIKSSSCPW